MDQAEQRKASPTANLPLDWAGVKELMRRVEKLEKSAEGKPAKKTARARSSK